MADTKVSALTGLSSVAADDEMYIIDVSDTTDGSDGTSKKVTITNLFNQAVVGHDTINENTTGSGVTVDGVLLKDSQVSTDVINELSAASGVTIDGVQLKDSAVVVDTISEKTATNGVAVDGLTIKDAGFALGSDADGDMYYRSSGALTRLAKGTAGQTLVMNSGATAPEWAESAQTTARFHATLTGDQAYTATAFATVVFNAEEYDSGSAFNTATGTYTCPVTGYYLFIASVQFATTADADQLTIEIRDDGIAEARAGVNASGTNDNTLNIQSLLYCGANSAITVTARNASNDDTLKGTAQNTFFMGHLMSV